MKYLKEFETQAAYEAAQSGLILPNVSLTVDNNTVHYNPRHDYVEIGGVKWATMNIGATSVTDYGLYFQWGDTQGYTASQVGSGEGQKYFYWNDYKWYNNYITKYNYSDGLTTLQSSDDAVAAAWGGNWRMPTTAEYQALGNAVNKAWTSDYQGSGVSGLVLTDKIDSSKVLFFPAAGGGYESDAPVVGRSGCYWSSSLASPSVEDQQASLFFFDDAYERRFDGKEERMYGFSIRGVSD